MLGDPGVSGKVPELNARRNGTKISVSTPNSLALRPYHVGEGIGLGSTWIWGQRQCSGANLCNLGDNVPSPEPTVYFCRSFFAWSNFTISI